jgi:ATP-dependent RNA circularization protein (DNA/RNA ligase family)
MFRLIRFLITGYWNLERVYVFHTLSYRYTSEWNQVKQDLESRGYEVVVIKDWEESGHYVKYRLIEKTQIETLTNKPLAKG